MGVEKDYRLEGLVKRRTLFTVHVRKAGAGKISIEVPRSSTIAKKLDAAIKLPYTKRKNLPIWMKDDEIVDVILPQDRGMV